MRQIIILLVVTSLQSISFADQGYELGIQLQAGRENWDRVPGRVETSSQSIALKYSKPTNSYSGIELGFGLRSEGRSGIYNYEGLPNGRLKKKILIIPSMIWLRIFPKSFIRVKLSFGFESKILLNSYLENLYSDNSSDYKVSMFYDKYSISPRYYIELALGSLAVYFSEWYSYPSESATAAGLDSIYLRPGEIERLSGFGIRYTHAF